MGFKCPTCHEDFGTNKSNWENHVQKCNNGVTALLVKAVTKTCETKPKEHNLEEEIRKLIKSARDYTKKGQTKEREVLTLLQDILSEHGNDLSNFRTKHFNASNLEEAITCYISYGEYSLSELMKEIKSAIKGG